MSSRPQLGLPPVRGEDLSEAEATYGFPPVRGGRGAPSMFPRKLYQILCETDPAIISWDEDGTSWHIANYEEYIEGVMPLFYRHNKLTSFQRQLNLYGFKKRGRDEKNPGHYYHPYFQRDRPEILGGVRRSYPVTSPKWVSQGGPEDARRKRVARFPGREGGPFAARPEPNLPPHYRQHHMYPQPRARHPGYGPMFDDEAAMIMEEDPAAMMMAPGGGGGGGGEEGAGPLGGRKRGAPSQWFYSSSNPAVAENVAAARLKRSNMQQRSADATGDMADGSNGHHGGDPWAAAGAARSNNPYGRSGSAAGGPEGGGDKQQLARRDSYSYSAANGRSHWEGYREQEDAYPLPSKVGEGAGGGGWYDSEESGLSRLTSCDSGSSAWDEVHAHPGGARDPRGDPRRAAASRYPHHPDGGGAGMMGGRPMMGGPPHRSAPPTSAMFPAHLMRHERFGRYPPGGGGAYDYPPPPSSMYGGIPPHAYPPPPDSNAGGGGGGAGASRWRPIFNGGHGGPGGGGGGGGDDGFDGWRDGPAGPLPGEDPSSLGQTATPADAMDKEKTAVAGPAASAAAAAAADSPGSGSTPLADTGQDRASKADAPAAAPAAEPPTEAAAAGMADAATKATADAAQTGAGSEAAGETGESEGAEKAGGAYRAECEEFLTEDDGADGGKGPEKKGVPAAAPSTTGGFHFAVPKPSGSAVGVGAGVASLPMAATAV